MLTVPSHLKILETKKSSSLNDHVHAAANDMAPIKYEQCSYYYIVDQLLVCQAILEALSLGKVQRMQSNFQMFDKKAIPGDRHLRRALKRAGKHAGIHITTGFTIIVHKPIEHHHAP